MFDNPGSKLKNRALWCYFLELIIFLAVGIYLISGDEIAIGVIVIVVGFVIPFDAALMMYAYGELVQTSTDNEKNTQRILYLLEKKLGVGEDCRDKGGNNVQGKPSAPAPKHQSDVPYWCANCGQPGPYEEKCPLCGSKVKRFQ